MQGGGPLYMVGTHSEETKALMARDPPPLQLSKGGGGERSLGQIIHYRVKLIPPPPCSTAGGEETKELMRQKALGRKHSSPSLQYCRGG